MNRKDYYHLNKFTEKIYYKLILDDGAPLEIPVYKKKESYKITDYYYDVYFPVVNNRYHILILGKNNYLYRDEINQLLTDIYYNDHIERLVLIGGNYLDYGLQDDDILLQLIMEREEVKEWLKKLRKYKKLRLEDHYKSHKQI